MDLCSNCECPAPLREVRPSDYQALPDFKHLCVICARQKPGSIRKFLQTDPHNPSLATPYERNSVQRQEQWLIVESVQPPIPGSLSVVMTATGHVHVEGRRVHIRQSPANVFIKVTSSGRLGSIGC